MNDAYVVYAEWGPARRIPRGERLARRFAQVDAGTRMQWMEMFEAVERSIWDLAEHHAKEAHTDASIVEQLQTRHPWMQKKALRQALFLVRYYAWHEGYDQ